MKTIKTFVLLLLLILSGAMCYANIIAGTRNEKGESITLEIKRKAFQMLSIIWNAFSKHYTT